MTAGVDEVCYRDAYARSAEARVLEVARATGRRSSSSTRTVFYPGGGGQPSDRGLILRAADGRSWTVTAARESAARSSTSWSRPMTASRRRPATSCGSTSTGRAATP